MKIDAHLHLPYQVKGLHEQKRILLNTLKNRELTTGL